MTTELPAWLTEAVAEYRRTARPTIHATPRGARGEIALATSVDGTHPSFVLVCKDYGRYLEVRPIHSAPEMATDVDYVLGYDDTSVVWPVVIETDLVGQVWPHQLQYVVGYVDVDNLSTIGRRGLAIASKADPRWQHKVDEFHEFQRITRDCQWTLLDELHGTDR